MCLSQNDAVSQDHVPHNVEGQRLLPDLAAGDHVLDQADQLIVDHCDLVATYQVTAVAHTRQYVDASQRRDEGIGQPLIAKLGIEAW